MQEITYRQAAELLNCQYITIRHAVSAGRLTKCSGKTSLLKEQVELFKGKRGISMHSLKLEEKQLWEEYKKIAENPDLLIRIDHLSMTNEDVLKQMIENKTNNDKEVTVMLLTSTRENIEEILTYFNINPTMPLMQLK